MTRHRLALALAFPDSLALRHPGHLHALVNPFALSKKRWIIARRASAEAVDCIGWVDRKPGQRRGMRFIKLAEIGQGGGEIEMGVGKISIDFDRAAEPRDRLLVVAEIEFGNASRPAGGEKDREIVSVAGSMLVTRFVNPDAATRYGNMIYVRCA